MPVSNLMRLTSLTPTPGTPWNADLQIVPFPATWLAALRDAYHRPPGIKPDWSLPTRGVVELLTGLDPAIVNVSSNLTSGRFLAALPPGADTTVLAAAVAAWATTEVTPDGSDIDWWELCQSTDLQF